MEGLTFQRYIEPQTDNYSLKAIMTETTRPCTFIHERTFTREVVEHNHSSLLKRQTALTRHELPQFLGNDFPDDSLTGTPELFTSLEVSSVLSL